MSSNAGAPSYTQAKINELNAMLDANNTAGAQTSGNALVASTNSTQYFSCSDIKLVATIVVPPVGGGDPPPVAPPVVSDCKSLPNKIEAMKCVMKKNNCYSCHASTENYTSNADFLNDEEFAGDIVSGNGAASNFYKVLLGQGTSSYRSMPPQGTLMTADEANIFKAWINSLPGGAACE